MKHKLFELKLNSISLERCVSEITDKAKQNVSAYLCAVNVHMLVTSQKDHVLKKAVNSAMWAVTDGKPIAWTYSHFIKKQERIAGMDITPKLLKKANEESLIISVYGNTDSNLKKFKSVLKKAYPKVKIGELISPPFRNLSLIEEEAYIKKINDANSQLVFVSLGCPKQEKWMYINSKKINGVCLGIGNAINVFVGEEKRPPLFIQNIGMEWFYRLIQNPKRLIKRYMITNTIFCIMVLKKTLYVKKDKG